MNSSKYTPVNRSFKTDFVKSVEFVVPKVYINQDIEVSGTGVSITDSIINSHIKTASIISSITPVSSPPNSVYSSINTINGIAPFFVKQNNLSKITPLSFEKRILNKLGVSLKNFNSSSDFSDYITTNLLSSIRVNNPRLVFSDDSTLSANQDYLITNLSWLYFLNKEQDSNLIAQPSALVRDLIVNNIFNSKNIELHDCIDLLTEFIWDNYSVCSVIRNNKLVCSDFLPNSYIPVSNAWTSGTQNLDKLKTLNYAIYSPLYSDLGDTKVRDAFQDYIDTGTYISLEESKGPLYRLLRSFAFGFFDRFNEVDQLRTLDDIEECPDDYLPLLAELIGWPLYGADPDRWRLQLVNAVDVYKKTGTKKSIQFAANSIFAKDVFDIEAHITELWESYVPYLMYYALATECSSLKSFNSWTREKADSMGVSGYSISSMDTNIRSCVDKIIVDLVKDFRDNFKYGASSFPVNDPTFIFSYRERILPIPPFEEFPYYVNTVLTDDFIDAIVDKLICFGVRSSFAIALGEFIKNNTIRVDDDIHIKNTWLFFTSGYNSPPNFETIVQNISENNSEYLSLWSGKSSHFNVTYDAISFDFAKNTLEADSSEALVIASKLVNEFSPAHAIPNLSLRLSATDTLYKGNVTLNYVDIPKNDYYSIRETSSAGYSQFMSSSFAMNTWKRNVSAGASVGRRDFDSLTDKYFVSGATAVLPRRGNRRRNYSKLIPKEGIYTRTGFNMPVTWDVSVLERSMASSQGFLPLGFIPSSQKYYPISSVGNLPDVYSKYQNLSSVSSFFGVAVSATFPTRGLRRLESNAIAPEYGNRPDYYVDRDQAPDIINVMVAINERAKLLLASAIVSSNYSYYASSLKYRNIAQEIANSGINSYLWDPSSMDFYYNFKFGRDLQKLYKIYTSLFNRHATRLDFLTLDGPTIFGHTFGSIFRNSKFDRFGSLGNYVTTSVQNVMELNSNVYPFVSSVPSPGYVASSVSSQYIDNYEIRIPSIISGVELTMVSGGTSSNSFTIFNLNGTDRTSFQSEYMFDKTFIRLKNVNGLPRVRFSFTYANPTDEGYPFTNNFLIPDHLFNIKIKALAGEQSGRYLGGSKLGMFIHTPYEYGSTWVFTPNLRWELIQTSSFDSNDVINLYSHIFQFNNIDRDNNSNSTSASTRRYKCLDIVENRNTPNTLLTYGKEDFQEFSLDFNTCNNYLSVPNYYYKNNVQVHRTNQNYIIEIFMLPNTSTDKFVLFESINVVDKTLNLWSQILVSGVPTGLPGMRQYCPEYRTPLSKRELMTILKFFNNIASNNASRLASTTSSIYEVSGGSRVNYRLMPAWYGPTVVGDLVNIIRVRN